MKKRVYPLVLKSVIIKLMKTLEFSYKKAIQAINYLAQKEGGVIDKLKVVKLLYFADRYHLRRYGRLIINDTYWAMKMGPVASASKDILDSSDFMDNSEKEYSIEYLVTTKKEAKEYNIKSKKEPDTTVFSQTDLEALDFVYKNLGKKTGGQLVNESHRYPEWSRFKSALETGITSREQINYSDFFNDPEDGREDIFSLPKENLNASRQVFSDQLAVIGFFSG